MYIKYTCRMHTMTKILCFYFLNLLQNIQWPVWQKIPPAGGKDLARHPRKRWILLGLRALQKRPSPSDLILWFTLWLWLTVSYWTWPFIVDVPIKNVDLRTMWVYYGVFSRGNGEPAYWHSVTAIPVPW